MEILVVVLTIGGAILWAMIIVLLTTLLWGEVLGYSHSALDWYNNLPGTMTEAEYDEACNDILRQHGLQQIGRY